LSPLVVAIGLDSFDPERFEVWSKEGHLPHLDRLRREGAYCRLGNPSWYRAEQGWTTLLTGCEPSTTGYWTDLRFDPADYGVDAVGAYGYREIPPFYALGTDYRIGVFDVPQAVIVDGVEGIQVLAWGAHSPRGSGLSRPTELIDELVRAYGTHPAFERDHASFWNPLAKRRLVRALATGIERRVAICRDLLGRQRWDLFLTAFGEPHSVGHYLWHLTDERHPLHRSGGRVGRDPVLEIYRRVDRAVGEILDAAPPGSSVVVFSQEGMEPNSMDLPGLVFLPELLFRFNYPDAVGLAWNDSAAPPDAIISRPRSLAWHRDLYARRHDSHPWRSRLRHWLPIEWTHRWERTTGPGPGPAYPKRFGSLFYQPPVWYKDLWPEMTCFALPTFSEGYVRVNLVGREKQGRVVTGEYSPLCERITALLGGLRDARTGQAMVKEVVRTRRSPLDRDPRLPDADLIVVWNEIVADVVEHAELGRIGPVPFTRTGGHSDTGFAIVKGPGFTPGTVLADGNIKDVAPTILSLMGAPQHRWLEGSSLRAVGSSTG
jgi:predicted AlkP superfamily phosphohydrolase/phosphomutase